MSRQGGLFASARTSLDEQGGDLRQDQLFRSRQPSSTTAPERQAPAS